MRYFPAIDHAILKQDLRRRIVCERTLWLMDAIVDGSNPQEPVNLYYPGDDLFTPFERRRGLPIGNLTSQIFANIHLDGLDHFIKEVLRAKGYLRYVDDFALFHDDETVLADWQARIGAYLARRRLSLHPDKSASWALRRRALSSLPSWGPLRCCAANRCRTAQCGPPRQEQRRCACAAPAVR